METLLTLAAAIGNEFELPVVAEVAGLFEDAALELIEHAAAGGLVVETPSGVDRFAVGHGLVVDALVSTLPGVRRRRVHARIADVLERAADANAGGTPRLGGYGHNRPTFP